MTPKILGAVLIVVIVLIAGYYMLGKFSEWIDAAFDEMDREEKQ